MSWDSNGVITNPGVNAILADTGAFASSGGLQPIVLIDATVALSAVFEWIDTDGTTVIKSQTIPALAGAPPTNITFPVVGTTTGQRFRLRNASLAVGQTQGAIFT